MLDLNIETKKNTNFWWYFTNNSTIRSSSCKKHYKSIEIVILLWNMKFLYHIYCFYRIYYHYWESHDKETGWSLKRACIAMTTPTPACAPGPTSDNCSFSGKARPPEGREIILTRSWASKSRIYSNNLYVFIYTKNSIYHIHC